MLSIFIAPCCIVLHLLSIRLSSCFDFRFSEMVENVDVEEAKRYLE